MGREIRLVPKGWSHPRDIKGHEIPLHDFSYDEILEEWLKGLEKWNEGLKDDWKGEWKPLDDDEKNMTWADWSGERPIKEDYMPQWEKSELTHIMMYENTSEGTPISPAFPKDQPEKLARWLVDNNARAFAGQGANYEGWLATIKNGYACSAVMTNGSMMSGVQFSAEETTNE